MKNTKTLADGSDDSNEIAQLTFNLFEGTFSRPRPISIRIVPDALETLPTFLK